MPKLHLSADQIVLSCSAILFDLDGVLIDSTSAVERVWRSWAHKHGFQPEYVLQNARGYRTVDTIRTVAPHLNADAESVAVESIAVSELEGILVPPGVRELLRDLPLERFTIVTSASRALAQARLQFAGLPIPIHFVSSDDVTQGKPHPQPYLKGAELLGVKAHDALVFEDSAAGIKAAKTAGMRVIALTTNTSGEELRIADGVVNSFKDLHVRFDGDTLTFLVGLDSKRHH